MTKKKISSILFAAFSTSMLLAACGTDDSDPINEGSEGENSIGPVGGDLVISSQSDAVSLDAHGSNDVPSSNVAYNIYESLLVLDENMELEPGLAIDWEQVDDHTWEFILREDVTFHDGSEFNAEVVQANFDRVLDEAIASPRANLYEMIEEVVVVDEHTVQFVTEYPFAPLPMNLSHSGGGIMSLETIEEDYAAVEEGAEPGSVINENPVGTGPFEFESWSAGDEIVLTRNDDYWDGEVALDSITFRVVPEGATRLADLETGQVHVSDPLSPSDIARVEQTDGMFAEFQPSVGINYIGFNTQQEPFNDPLVRQAISMAVDKESIVEGIYDGVGIAAEGPLAPEVPGHSSDIQGLDYDIDAAQELLEEAGYQDGFSTTIWTNDTQERVDIATAVQAQLEEIGVDVEIEVLEWGAYLENTAAGEHDMFILGWTNSTADPDNGLFPLFHSSQIGDPGNRSFYENEVLDSLLEEGRQTSDEEERNDIYNQAQELLIEDAPVIFAHHQEYVIGVSEDVNDLVLHPTGLLILEDVTLNQ